MRVVGYVRVSTAEQAAEGVSLAAQRAKLAGYCALHDLELLGVEADEGASAKSLDRPGLRAALAMLEHGRAEGLVIAKLDRLSRSVADWNDLIAAHFGPAAGAQLFSVADSIDTRTAAGRLVLNVIMSVAQWERETIVERTLDALAHKRSRGERLGQVPYGFALDPGGRTTADGRPIDLVPDAAELRVVALVGELRAGGLSARGIAAELTARGIPTKSGRPRWSHTTVAGILARTAPEPHQGGRVDDDEDEAEAGRRAG